MSRITVIGGGYVGLVTSACFAELGHEVRCLESNPGKVQLLRQGQMPIEEPGLSDLWAKHAAAGRLTVSSDPEAALAQTDFIYIAVGTPEAEDGSADLRYVEAAVRTAVKHSDLSHTICIKSTVPPGTCARLEAQVHAYARRPGWTVVSNPEFLSQGRAVEDFLRPDRIVAGSSSLEESQKVADLYASLGAPVVITDSTTSELIKYASNSFLALKISFINEVARLCEHAGADVDGVALGMGLDRRIGPKFLQAGLGWGGSCFPKDTAALEYSLRAAGLDSDTVTAARSVNARQVSWVTDRLASLLPSMEGAQVAVLGLTFKPGTDDLRGTQSLPLVERLLAAGCDVRVHDPASPQLPPDIASKVTVCATPGEALSGASAMVLATAWPEYLAMDFGTVHSLMQAPVVIDPWRVLDIEDLQRHGFTHYRLGDGRTGAHAFAESEPEELLAA